MILTVLVQLIPELAKTTVVVAVKSHLSTNAELLVALMDQQDFFDLAPSDRVSADDCS